MDIRWPEMTDELGPAEVVLLHDPDAGLQGIVVVDNVACGPAIGGLRMAATVDVDEVRRLARTMTLKSAAVGLPHGGAKAGIVSSPKLAAEHKERLIRSFARAMRTVTDYIPGPDMGTDESAMAFIRDEIGRAVGLPRVLGGIPLDEIGATGFGLAVSATAAQSYTGVPVEGARVVVQGFGNVGTHAARELAKRGAVVVAVGDSGGAVTRTSGLDVRALIAHKREGASVHEFSGGDAIDAQALVGVDCDIWVPAAQPNVLTMDNVARLAARVVLCGANIPVTPEAEAELHEAGVFVIPDFIANAGGLICAAVEYGGGTEAGAFSVIEDRIARNTAVVLERARERQCQPREAAVELAEARVREAMRYRRGASGPA